MSKTRLVQTQLNLKFWTNRTPEVGTVRPARCAGCGAASHPPGRKLVVVGHGVRMRQLRGPCGVGQEPEVLEIRVRRYRCRACGAVLTAGPPEALRYRLFSLVAIVAALSMYGAERVSSREVRRRVSPWRVVGAAAERTWQTLQRWIRAARAGHLFPFAMTARGAPREVAERVSRMLMAKAPPSWADLPVTVQVVQGALQATMGITPCASVGTASTTQASF